MPNAAKKPAENTAPKKKRSFAAIKKSRKARAARKNPAPSANPPIVQDFTHVILPGFVAYGLTRVLQRIAFVLVGKRWPKLAKHAHAFTGVASATGAWFGAHRIKALEPYHDSILMGSSIAALQGIYSNYVPQKYGWLLSDCNTTDLPQVQAQLQQMKAQQASAAASQTTDDDDLADLTGQLGSLAGGSIGGGGGGSTAASDVDDKLAEELGGDEDLSDLYSGTFAN